VVQKLARKLTNLDSGLNGLILLILTKKKTD
jgi:hypothetical protein